MLFGIDFGTTNTVVSYINFDKVEFIKFENEIFLKSIYNLKRKICYKEDDLTEITTNFFKKIHDNIAKTFPNEEYFCTLSIPVRFDDISRNFIKKCALKANLNIIKLIYEPVAACIFECFDKKNGNYLVYDLGGGTFDISLVKKMDNIFQVLKVDGLESFGGDDLDLLISKELNISLIEAEKYKIDQQFPEKIEKMIEKELEKTYEMTTNLAKNYEIDELILIGGSSKLFLIKKHFEQFFKTIETDFQTVVSKGCAMYFYLKEQSGMELIDATPFNLGIELLNDEMDVIIEQNSPIPIKKRKYFYPYSEKIAINILQGNSNKASECVLLKKFEISAKKEFLVEFLLDCDGILSVKIDENVQIISNIFEKM